MQAERSMFSTLRQNGPVLGWAVGRAAQCELIGLLLELGAPRSGFRALSECIARRGDAYNESAGKSSSAYVRVACTLVLWTPGRGAWSIPTKTVWEAVWYSG